MTIEVMEHPEATGPQHFQPQQDPPTMLLAPPDSEYDDMAMEEKKVEEEGQEALWIEVEPSPSPVAQKPTKPSFRFPSPAVGRLRKPTSHNTNPQSDKPSKSHVLLMDKQHTVVETRAGQAVHDDAVAESKAQTARRMLLQALAQRSKPWAQSAFGTAMESRLLVEGSVTGDLQNLLDRACENGIQAVVKGDIREAHLCMGQLIDCVGVATTTADVREGGEDLDDISTLGFDNTFEAPLSPRAAAAANKAELLSVTSLNEILDAPLDDPAGGAMKKSNAAPAKPRKRFTFLRQGGTTPKDVGGVPVRDPAKSHGRTGVSNVGRPTAKSKSKKWTIRKSKGSGVEAPIASKPAIQRFAAKVVTEDDDDDDDAPTPFENKVKEIDILLNERLKEALENDDDESVTSLHGVPLHEEKDDKKSKKKNAKNDAVPIKHRPQAFDKKKPQFTAAPRGEPHILLQKSWESLEAEGALPSDPSSSVPPPPPPPPPPRRTNPHSAISNDRPIQTTNADLDPLVVPIPSISPASTGISAPDDGNDNSAKKLVDKYTINPNVDEDRPDKYALPETEINSDPAPCSLWQSCMDAVRVKRAPPPPAAATTHRSSFDGPEVEPRPRDKDEEDRYLPASSGSDNGPVDSLVPALESAPTSHSSNPSASKKWRLPLYFIRRREGKTKSNTAVAVTAVSNPSTKLASHPLPAKLQTNPTNARNPRQHQPRPGRERTQTRTNRRHLPTTPKHYATVVSPPHAPNVPKPFTSFRTARPSNMLPDPLPNPSMKSSEASPVATTTAVEELVRTMSKQESRATSDNRKTTVKSKNPRSKTPTKPKMLVQKPLPPSNNKPPTISTNVVPVPMPHESIPPIKPPTPKYVPTTSLIFGPKAGPFAVSKQPSALQQQHTATTLAASTRTTPSKLQYYEDDGPTHTTTSTPTTATSASVDHHPHNHPQSSKFTVPSNPTMDSSTSDDSLVHMIKEQQNRPHRGVDPADFLAVASNDHRGIDP